jgi:hypothetical protein
MVRMVDDHRVGGGDVDARLDDRRADENVRLAADEPEHDLLQLARIGIWPWPTTIRASGTSDCTSSAIDWMLCTRLCTKNTCPSRASSRSIACSMRFGS